MEKEQQQLAALVRGKKVAFIGAGVSHRALIEEFVGLGAQATKSRRWRLLGTTPPPSGGWGCA